MTLNEFLKELAIETSQLKREKWTIRNSAIRLINERMPDMCPITFLAWSKDRKRRMLNNFDEAAIVLNLSSDTKGDIIFGADHVSSRIGLQLLNATKAK